MILCRFSEFSDVYIKREGTFICRSCRMNDMQDFVAGPAEMVMHLVGHHARGHQVPRHVLEELLAELCD